MKLAEDCCLQLPCFGLCHPGNMVLLAGDVLSCQAYASYAIGCDSDWTMNISGEPVAGTRDFRFDIGRNLVLL
jgi:hypothetical protein